MLNSISIRVAFCVFVLHVHPSFRHLSRSSFTWWTCVWSALTSTQMWSSFSSHTVATGSGPMRLRWCWWLPPWAKPWEWPWELTTWELATQNVPPCRLCSASFRIRRAAHAEAREAQPGQKSPATPWHGWCWRICPRRGGMSFCTTRLSNAFNRYWNIEIPKILPKCGGWCGFFGFFWHLELGQL